MGEEPSTTETRARLLSWYNANRRDLPFRRTRDPYRILVAEYVLQRTRIASGVPYYHRFLKRFPSVQVLAAASLDDVLAAWEGLGFYRRARNLHAAAQAIVGRFGGEIPRSYDDLESLPGMGPYTAGAVASIAFGIHVPAVDGNVTRVIVRLFRIREDVRTGATRRHISEVARGLVSPEDPGAFNQAMMELGATVCTPKSPACGRCPLESLCLARAAGEEQELPVVPRSRALPIIPVVFALVEARGNILLVRRPAGALLAGLWSLPGGETADRGQGRQALRALVRDQAGIYVAVGSQWAPVERTFSHRKWLGAIYRCTPRGHPKSTEAVRWISHEAALRLPLVPFHREAIKALRGLESFAGERSDSAAYRVCLESSVPQPVRHPDARRLTQSPARQHDWCVTRKLVQPLRNLVGRIPQRTLERHSRIVLPPDVHEHRAVRDELARCRRVDAGGRAAHGRRHVKPPRRRAALPRASGHDRDVTSGLPNEQSRLNWPCAADPA